MDISGILQAITHKIKLILIIHMDSDAEKGVWNVSFCIPSFFLLGSSPCDSVKVTYCQCLEFYYSVELPIVLETPCS